MKTVQIVHFGGPRAFRLVDLPSPPMAPASVRIAVRAAGVNLADVMMRLGLYPEAPRRPFIPGYEVAGVVTETGPQVKGIQAGDRVLAACRFGGYTEEIVLPQTQVRPIPNGLSDIEAAAIPVNFLTAWIALHEMARVREGDRVLIPGAAGGVGTAAVQLAARAGARVVGLAGTEEKLSTVLQLGAREAYTYDQWARITHGAASGPAGRAGGRTSRAAPLFDVVLESRGGRFFTDSMALLALGGRIVSYGVSAMIRGRRRSVLAALSTLARTKLLTPIGLAMKNTGVFGVNMLTFFDSAEGMAVLARAMDGVMDGFRKGGLRVVVGKTFPLEDVWKAHEHLQSRKNVGKVVLTTG